MPTIHNPVLRGFNPDPTFLGVGNDYYLATSTFEWFPGVPIYHSKDLANWRLIGHALTRKSQLDLRGVGDSAGIWAPSLSFHDGLYYLIYTIVQNRIGVYKDVHNYLVTARDILGPWSDPVYLNSSGFDPSLFHDDDGRKWLVNMQWDFRKNHSRFAGIVLQEYNPERRKLTGPVKNIFSKPEMIEGPNLYKCNGYYYLMLAEGGTGWNHGISMTRAKKIDGPYETDPLPLLMTSRNNAGLTPQKAGHGELVKTTGGEWYMAHLAGRPVLPERRCVLGRETCIQKMAWSADGWLRLDGGGTDPKVEVPAPADLPAHPWPKESNRDDFDKPALDLRWCSLRVPFDESWATLRERPGWLRIRGRQSSLSLFNQSFLARRRQSFRCNAETCVEFEPAHFAQMAGLICWYDARTHYYLRITHDESAGKILGIILCDDGNYDELIESNIPIVGWKRCHLRAQLDEESLQFSASPDGRGWTPIGPPLDATKLSDDYGQGLHFTGGFVGICAQDLNGTMAPADFDYFEMTNLDPIS